MNFERMPELQWRYGYPVVLSSMGAGLVATLVWLRHRRWL